MLVCVCVPVFVCLRFLKTFVSNWKIRDNYFLIDDQLFYFSNDSVRFSFQSMSSRRSVFKKSLIIKSESLDFVDEHLVSNSRIELIKVMDFVWLVWQNNNSRNVLLQDNNVQNQCRRSLRIKEGAHRIFSLSRNVFQKLDAAKAMLVSDKRIAAVTSNYDRLRLQWFYLVYRRMGLILM